VWVAGLCCLARRRGDSAAVFWQGVEGLCCSLAASYRHLQLLRAGRGSGPAVVIACQELPAAVATAERHGLEEPTPAGNKVLLAACTAGDDGAFLCLRCLVSEPLEQKIRAIHRERGHEYGLDLVTLASFALDDAGEPLSFAALKALPESRVRPFTAQVICSYQVGKGADLPHWARTRIQASNELKAYLREHGVLLISTWALLADSSPRRVREALELFGMAALTLDRGLALHRAYRQAYGPAKERHLERTGRQSGWEPDEAFLLEIAPDQAMATTLEQLRAMDQAIRRLLTQRGMASLEALAEQGVEPASAAGLDQAIEAGGADEAAEQLAAIQGALERSCEPEVRAALEADRSKWLKSPERRQAWQLYGEGAGQRAIAEALDKGQTWVSRLLQEKRLATAIATAAALDLKRLPSFAAVGTSVDGAERLVEALRNHLITPEREGERAPLRSAVARVLAALS